MQHAAALCSGSDSLPQMTVFFPLILNKVIQSFSLNDFFYETHKVTFKSEGV